MGQDERIATITSSKNVSRRIKKNKKKAVEKCLSCFGSYFMFEMSNNESATIADGDARRQRVGRNIQAFALGVPINFESCV